MRIQDCIVSLAKNYTIENQALENVSIEMATSHSYVSYTVIPSRYMQRLGGISKIDGEGEKRLYFYPPRFDSRVYEIN